ncbi:unnamed protein product [Lymnaea stagnalis]|uniref:Uncharacterized protein n=1 Tax=Lymnaea stagnalis TaxID=6523 RepID=A0AAV2HMD4_LYMST
MWTQVALFVLITTLTVCHIHAQSVCGFPPTIWRNANRTCPARAVCGDVFTTRRDWMNGTTCAETRVINNCFCPGNLACPVNNDAHRLYTTAQQKIYTCEPVCNLGWCYNIRLGLSEGRSDPTIAMTVEEQTPDFGGNTFTRMGCRCPRHHVPNRQPPGVPRAVKTHSYIRNPTTRHYTARYTCKVSGTEGNMVDPCPRHVPVK